MGNLVCVQTQFSRALSNDIIQKLPDGDGERSLTKKDGCYYQDNTKWHVPLLIR